MSFVRLARESFGGDAIVLCPCRSLKNMKRVKTDRLLHFDCRKPRPFRLDIAHLYVALPPELIHVFFLLSQQTGETLTDNPIEGPVCPAGHLVGVFGFR